jgi:hypothetical protein
MSNGSEDSLDYANVFRPLSCPLGEFIIEFAKLESKVTLALNALMKIDYREGIVVENKLRNFGDRIKKLDSLAAAHCKADNLKTAARELFFALEKANDDRNNLIHGAWNGYSPSTQTFSKVRVWADKDGNLHDTPVHGVTLEILNAEIAYLKQIQGVLADWYYRFIRQETDEALPPPLTIKLPDQSPLGALIADNSSDRGTG